MSEETPQTADTRPSLALRAQYVKDLSFENPRAPGSLFGLREPPQMEVSVNLGAQALEENVVEIAMHIAVRAVSEKTTIFLSDLVYAGILELRNIQQDQMDMAIFVQGAQLLFPFARRVISDITRDGGFPGLQLEPMDFYSLYMEQRQQRAASGNPATQAS